MRNAGSSMWLPSDAAATRLSWTAPIIATNQKSIGGYFAHRFVSFQIQSTAFRGRQPEKACVKPDLDSPDGRPLLPANIYGHGFQSHMRKRLREAAHQSIRFRVVFLRQESCVAPQPHDLQRQRPRPLCPVRTRSTIEWNWVDSQLLRQMDCSLHA
jgi:hypothetical protein